MARRCRDSRGHYAPPCHLSKRRLVLVQAPRALTGGCRTSTGRRHEAPFGNSLVGTCATYRDRNTSDDGGALIMTTTQRSKVNTWPEKEPKLMVWRRHNLAVKSRPLSRSNDDAAKLIGVLVTAFRKYYASFEAEMGHGAGTGDGPRLGDQCVSDR